MHIYILGICGTFMGSLAILAREMGLEVSGCDENVYPPMSTQLENAGIKLDKGYVASHLDVNPDLIVVGNAMSRGNPMVEHVLDKGLAYTSGPQFLHDHVIRDKWVLAVAGTHGKTTTSSMLAWILEYAGMSPGFLIGGVLKNFPFSARIGESDFFVVEADEYDTAFFDKRSKFVHYQPKTLVLNNLEFDHADIFDDISDIKKQFHHVVRIVPSIGKVVFNAQDSNIADVIEMGCWSEKSGFSIGESGSKDEAVSWVAKLLKEDGTQFEIVSKDHPDEKNLVVHWELTGQHNVNNALAAIAAAENVGVLPSDAAKALSEFGGVKRRMEKIAEVNGITIYDDFAHHPTAIETTLSGLRAKTADRIIAVIEPRSNTMRMGVHGQQLAESVKKADKTCWFMADVEDWELGSDAGDVYSNIDDLLNVLVKEAQSGDHIVIMSNGGFYGLHKKLADALEEEYGS